MVLCWISPSLCSLSSLLSCLLKYCRKEHLALFKNNLIDLIDYRKRWLNILIVATLVEKCLITLERKSNGNKY